jgi:hypothetical protein
MWKRAGPVVRISYLLCRGDGVDLLCWKLHMTWAVRIQEIECPSEIKIEKTLRMLVSESAYRRGVVT